MENKRVKLQRMTFASTYCNYFVKRLQVSNCQATINSNLGQPLRCNGILIVPGEPLTSPDQGSRFGAFMKVASTTPAVRSSGTFWCSSVAVPGSCLRNETSCNTERNIPTSRLFVRVGLNIKVRESKLSTCWSMFVNMLVNMLEYVGVC